MVVESGSVVAITDGAGAVSQRMSYAPWSKRREPDWRNGDQSGVYYTTDVGFTGHVMLDDHGLVHMQGPNYWSFPQCGSGGD